MMRPCTWRPVLAPSVFASAFYGAPTAPCGSVYVQMGPGTGVIFGEQEAFQTREGAETPWIGPLATQGWAGPMAPEAQQSLQRSYPALFPRR